MSKYALYFEELEAHEELTEWWEYALAGAAGIACGIVVYVIVAGAAT
ncbi:MAG: hypothetical protein N2489_04600 [Clostridia bacterium]|nr:hypothetical protein [Clostridia bacterium]